MDSTLHPDNQPKHSHHPDGRVSKPRQISRQLIQLFVPPLAQIRHRHYTNRHPAHLWLDTLLALIIFVLVGWNLFHMTSQDIIPAPKIVVTITADQTIELIGTHTIKVAVHNLSDTIVSDVSWQQYNPVSVGSNDRSFTESLPAWTIGQLAPGQEVTQKYNLSVMGGVDDHGTINGWLSFHSGVQNFTQSASMLYTIIRPAFTVSITGPDTVQSGVPYNITAEIVNTTNQTIPQPMLTVVLPDDTKLTAARPTAGSDGLTWEWLELAPEAKQAVTLTLLSEISVSSDLLVSAQGFVRQDTTRLLQSEGKYNWRVIPPKTIEKVISQPNDKQPSVTLVAEARYYGTTGVQLGYGPIPPKVGQLTGYRIYWLIRNTGQTVNGIRLTAVLPNEVSWVGNTANSIGQSVRYNSARREVSWTLDEFPSDMQMATASFEITVTPESQWVGRVMPLLNVTTLTGKYRSGLPTKVTVPSLTTDLVGDQDPAHGQVGI